MSDYNHREKGLGDTLKPGPTRNTLVPVWKGSQRLGALPRWTLRIAMDDARTAPEMDRKQVGSLPRHRVKVTGASKAERRQTSPAHPA